jgi:hypothetical protein
MATSSADLENPFHSLVARNNNAWFAILHGVLLTDPRGQGAEFDSEEDAEALLAEETARAAGVDD